MCVDSCIQETFVILRINAAESPLNNENLLRYHSNLSRRDEATFIKLTYARSEIHITQNHVGTVGRNNVLLPFLIQTKLDKILLEISNFFQC